MTREYAAEMIKAIKDGLHETGKDFPYRDEMIPIAKEALEVAITTLESVSALSADLKSVDRNSMDEKVLIGFNMAIALFNKHLGGAE